MQSMIRVFLALALASSAAAATTRTLVFLRDPPGSAAALQAARGDRSEVLRVLKRRAARARRDLLAELGPGLRSARVEELWISSALALDAEPELMARLRRRPDVRRIERVRMVTLQRPLEPSSRNDLDPPDRTWGLAAIRALEARESFGVTGAGVVVGLLDTGVEAGHPDLAGRTLRFRDFVSEETEPYDDNGHGTHCAGTIAGGDGSGRAIGVAPGARLVAGKIFSKGGFTTTERILAGMQWVVDPDGVPGSGDEPRLVSNSWSGPAGEMTYLEAVQSWLALDIVPVFAASNSGPQPETVRTPGGYPESIAVAASTVDGEVAEFSSRGPVVWDGVEIIKPDVTAPGRKVLSAWPGGGRKAISGTSMATPHVAGLTALLLEANPDLTAAEVREILQGTAGDRGAPGKDNDWGWGLVDAVAAVDVARTGGLLRGRVLDPAGEPLAHADLVVEPTGRRVLLDQEAGFEVLLPSGTYTLRVEAFGFQPGSFEGIRVVKDGDREVALSLSRLPSGTLAGNLRGEGGAPVQGWMQLPGTGLPMQGTDAQGRVEVPVPAGTYSVLLQAYGYSPALLEGVAVAVGEATELDVVLDRPPPILVVDDDAGNDFESWFTAALDGLGESYQLLAHEAAEELTGRWLAQFEVVVWLTGKDNRDCLSRRDQKALAEYLDLGGRLFLSGQEVGYTIGESLFYRNRLRAVYVSDGTSYKTVSGSGLDFAIEGGDGADNQLFPDVIDAVEAPGVELFLRYGDGRGAGVRAVSGNSRVVYLPFGLEGVDTAGNRRALMASVLGFLRPDGESYAARIDAVEKTPAASEADAADLSRLGLALGDLVGLRFPAESLDLTEARRRQRRRNFEAR